MFLRPKKVIFIKFLKIAGQDAILDRDGLQFAPLFLLPFQKNKVLLKKLYN